MTKVERLRDDLCQQIVDHDSFAGTLASTVLKAIDSLISAAHAEGVAEGKAAERERIGGIVCPDEDEHGDLTIGWLSLSVLAPTKEKP